MDAAYDHIQEQSFPEDAEGKTPNAKAEPSLNDEFKDAYKAFSKSPWGAKLGGLWGTVKKQSEVYYEEAQREYTAASASATKTFSEALSRTRALSLTQQDPAHATATDERAIPTSNPKADIDSSSTLLPSETEALASDTTVNEAIERPDSLPADILKETNSMLTKFRSEAAKRLKDIEKAEDAADEALLKFGTNLRNFFKDAIAVAPPSQDQIDTGKSSVMFESKDSEGKRVIHTTRFDAQLHVIHTSADSFTHDPQSEEWAEWDQEFDVARKTGDIAVDLEKYEELRRQMERLVPEKVEYRIFWARYYFLRHVVEEEEKKRRELLKGAAQAADTSDMAWDSDDEDADKATTPQQTTAQPNASTSTLLPASTQTTTIKDTSPQKPTIDNSSFLKPAESRKSNDQISSADSDASYDLVSGATSRAPGSPHAAAPTGKTDESDEEDWE